MTKRYVSLCEQQKQLQTYDARFSIELRPAKESRGRMVENVEKF
jgi:hypothetical protein